MRDYNMSIRKYIQQSCAGITVIASLARVVPLAAAPSLNAQIDEAAIVVAHELAEAIAAKLGEQPDKLGDSASLVQQIAEQERGLGIEPDSRIGMRIRDEVLSSLASTHLRAIGIEPNSEAGKRILSARAVAMPPNTFKKAGFDLQRPSPATEVNPSQDDRNSVSNPPVPDEKSSNATPRPSVATASPSPSDGNPKNGRPPPTDKDSDAQSMSSFDTKYDGKTTIATVRLVNAYAYMFKDNLSVSPHILGIKLSTSLPVGNVPASDYFANELLLREGGIVNAYFSFRWAKSSQYFSAENVWGDRKYAVDRKYLAVNYDKTGNVDNTEKLMAAAEANDIGLNDEILSYVGHGLGVKALKTSMDSSSTTSATSSAAAVGSFYLAWGFDGPFTILGGDEKQGGISFEAFGSLNVGNKKTINAMFGTEKAKAIFANYGVTGKIYLPGQFQIGVTYGAALGKSTRSFAKEVVSYSIGYNKNLGK